MPPWVATHGEDEVELSLLNEEEKMRAAAGAAESEEELGGSRPKRPLSTKDKKAIALLILLCVSTTTHYTLQFTDNICSGARRLDPRSSCAYHYELRNFLSSTTKLTWPLFS